MTYKELLNDIEFLKDERDAKLKEDIKQLQDKYLSQFKYLKEGDPIVLDDEFVGYFDKLYFKGEELHISCFNNPDGKDRTYFEYVAPDFVGARVAQTEEITYR